MGTARDLTGRKRTGQPRTDVPVIVCTHIQVVYSGVNITSPSTCAQANFS